MNLSELDIFTWVLVALILAQLTLASFDEFYFHRRRHLPRWERWGHPLDTLLVTACVGITVILPPDIWSVRSFIGLSIASALFVTKDEWVHQRYCKPEESWLHALMFLVHMPLLGVVGWTWYEGSAAMLRTALLLAMLGWSGYQVVYWNLLVKDSRRATNE